MRRHVKAVVAISALLLLTAALGATLARATAPAVTIEAPSSVSYTSVQVKGKVNPEDQETSFYFQYSKDPVNEGWIYGAFQGPLAANSGETSVSDTIGGLEPDTEYFFRLVAESADGQSISAEPNPSATTLEVGPPNVTIDAPTAVTADGAHFSGTIDPEAPGANPAAFDVQWRFECTPECPGLTGGSIPADSAVHTVEAEATKLQPNTSYEVRLIAENAAGPVSEGPESFQTGELAPDVYSSPTIDPAQTTATLAALVNPHNSAVSDCHFVYGPSAAYGQTVPCAQTPTGNEAAVVSADVFGLDADSGYHYRLFVTTSGGSAEGEDRSFDTYPVPQPEGTCSNEAIRELQGAQVLPECRAFEQVSPVDKGGANVLSAMPSQASIHPGAIGFTTNIGIPGHRSNTVKPFYRARRIAGNWTTDLFDLPQANAAIPVIKSTRMVSPDLTQSISATESSVPLTPDTSPDAGAVYQQNIETGGLELIAQESGLTTPLRESFLDTGGGPVYGSDANFGHLTFETRAPLVAGVTPGTSNVYQWDDGELSILSIMPNGLPAPEGAYLARALNGARQDQRWTSADGSRAFFFALDAAVGSAGSIYVREGGTTTRLVSYSQRTGDDPTQPASAYFEAASRDGRFVYYTSDLPLTDNTEGGMERLYRYDLEAEVLEAVTGIGDVSGVSGSIAVQRVSEDGRRVYFTKVGVEAPGAQPDTTQLYVWEDGESRLLAKVSGPSLDFFSMSDDGRYAEFATAASPTGYVSGVSSACPNIFGEAGSCEEVYAYDAEAETIRCLSCALSGGSTGSATTGLRPEPWPVYTPNATFADGAYLFDTPNALVPEDTNRARDVYEWRDGETLLISSGTDRKESKLLDADPSRTDVYFVTAGRLVRQDKDSFRDVYTAHRDGGLPTQNPVPGEGAECIQESCQGATQPPAPTPSVGSQDLKGNGNVDKPASLKVQAPKQIKGAQGKVKVKVSGPGTIKVGGGGVKAASRKVRESGSYAVSVVLNGAARSALHKHGSKSATVTVRFVPSQGEPGQKQVSLRFVRPGGSTSKGGK